MAAYMGDTGLGMCRSSCTQNSSRCPSSQSIGNSSSPKKVASTAPSLMPHSSLVGRLSSVMLPHGPTPDPRRSLMEQVTARVFTDATLRGCNPSDVLTDDGVVVIETPQLPTRAVAMRKEAEAHGPIRYLVNTEHHVDHIFGNYYFKGAGVVVNHQGVYDNFMTVHPLLDPFAYAAEAIPTDDPDGRTLFPDREEYYADPNKGRLVFTGDLTLRVGAHTFHLIHTPGHTPGQLAVYVPQEHGVHRLHPLIRVQD